MKLLSMVYTFLRQGDIAFVGNCYQKVVLFVLMKCFIILFLSAISRQKHYSST